MVDILSQNIMNLEPSERDQVFALMTQHAALLSRVIPGAPLLNLILNGIEDNSFISQAYVDWRRRSEG